ncbi:MAG TPA: CHASE3 domain-containing protein, partial [Sphingomonas sanguinis]|nr:CHASE3 domain-containing protein [Sphingomonas sanguinis]
MQGSPTLASAENPIGRILVAAMAIGFLALLVAAGAAGYVVRQTNRHSDWVIHTYRVESTLIEVRRLAEQQETARRGYMLAGTPAFLNSFERAHAELAPQVAELRRLTADNPRQNALMAMVTQRLAELDAAQRQTNALVQQGRGADALRQFRTDSGLQRMQKLRRVFDAMAREERRLLALRD